MRNKESERVKSTEVTAMKNFMQRAKVGKESKKS